MPDNSVEGSAEIVQREEVRAPSPSHVDVWINDAQISHTPWDFRIRLGTIREASASRLVVDESVTIRTSPQFIKPLIAALQSSLKQYEDHFGALQSKESDGKS